MSIWFLENPARLIQERKEIEQLQMNKNWLLGVEWTISGIELLVKVEMEAHGQTYELEMEYPSIFPYAPPSIIPVDKDNWRTEHQYINGPLCLEWGPDNWHSSISGATMLESAYQLIHTENPKGTKKGNDRSFVPSRHSLTTGQELRHQTIRLYLNQSILGILSEVTAAKPLEMEFQFSFQSKTVVLHILKIYDEGNVFWDNEYLPDSIKKEDVGKAKAFFIKETPANLKAIHSIEELTLFLELNGINRDSINLDNGSDRLFLLVDGEGNITPFLSFEGKDTLFVVKMTIENENVVRRQSDLNSLKDKKVGIVGLGSLGSKVANSLARSGIENFFLIDDDVFFAGNIERHTLDWSSVGVHKVDAIKNQLSLISSSIHVHVSLINLTGQESNSALNSVISRLGTCDIIIDATADSKVFNLLAAVSKGYNKPMVWGEVFAGGIGGLIARSRPKLDPSPQTMRQALFETTQNVPTISQVSTRPYELESETGEVWIASDINVGIIASHLSDLIVDTLSTEDSEYPYSMYLIGLKKAWIFEEPFATFPINTDHIVEEPFVEENSSNIQEVIDFIKPLLNGEKDD